MAPSRVVAVDLGATKIAAALLNYKGEILRRTVVNVETASSSAPVKQIVNLIRDLIGHKKIGGQVKAIGVAVPGLVRRDGTVWAPNLPGWRSMPLARRLKNTLRVPVIAESDRNAAALGETWRGAAKGKSDAIVLMLGTGIGAGILSGGRLIRGAHELAGCAGWMVVADTYGPEARSLGQLHLGRSPHSNWRRQPGAVIPLPSKFIQKLVESWVMLSQISLASSTQRSSSSVEAWRTPVICSSMPCVKV